MSDPQTIREHLEAQVNILQRLNEGEVTVELVQAAIHHNNRMHAIINLATPDRGGAFSSYRDFRLVPDPAPRGDAESNEDKIRKLYGPGTQGSVS